MCWLKIYANSAEPAAERQLQGLGRPVTVPLSVFSLLREQTFSFLLSLLGVKELLCKSVALLFEYEKSLWTSL